MTVIVTDTTQTAEVLGQAVTIEETNQTVEVLGDIVTVQDVNQTVEVSQTNHIIEIVEQSVTVQIEGVQGPAGADGSGGSATISDDPYSSSWNSDITTIASKNSIYDKIESLSSVYQAAGSYQTLDADLTAIAALVSTGILARTASNTWALRTLTGTSNQVNISNGDGVSGNPTFSLPQNIHTAASPTFSGLTLSGLTAGRLAYINTSGVVATDSALTWNNSAKILKVDSGLGNNTNQTGEVFYITDGSRSITLAGPDWSAVHVSGLYSSSRLLAGYNHSTALALYGTGLTQNSSGVNNLPLLSASLPLKLDSSKNITSAAINLSGSEVTGTLPGANIGTHTHAQSDITNLVSDLAAKQPLDSDLTTIAGLTATTDNFIVSVASAWASRTPAQVKTTLSLNNVDNTTDLNKPISTATQTALNAKIGGSTGSTDNRILRADGTGGSTLQSSGASINDSGGIEATTNSSTVLPLKLTQSDGSSESGLADLNGGHYQVDCNGDGTGPDSNMLVPCGYWKVSVNGSPTFFNGDAERYIYIPLSYEDCVRQGTPILTPEGYKAIEDLKAGDLVLSKNFDINELRPNRIAKYEAHPNARGRIVINEKLEISRYHKVWINDTWKPVTELQIGDYLRNSKNEKVWVFQLDWKDDAQPTYNLKMENQRMPNYYVGCGEDFLNIHNKCPFWFYYDETDLEYPWKCQGTFITGQEGIEKAGIHHLKLNIHSSVYYIRELEPEESHIFNLCLIADGKRLHLISKNISGTLKQGDIRKVEFEPIPEGTKELILESEGYYICK